AAQESHVVARLRRIDRSVAPFAVKVDLVPYLDGIYVANARTGLVAADERGDEVGIVLVIRRRPVVGARLVGQVRPRPVGLQVKTCDDLHARRVAGFYPTIGLRPVELAFACAFDEPSLEESLLPVETRRGSQSQVTARRVGLSLQEHAQAVV